MGKTLSIRAYAKSMQHKVVGKLTRRRDLEYRYDLETDTYIRSRYRVYIDEGGNEYNVYPGKGCTCIVTTDGGVI